MTKLIALRLEPSLIEFIDNIHADYNRSDKLRAVLLWLKEYQDSYLASVKDYLQARITKESQAP